MSYMYYFIAKGIVLFYVGFFTNDIIFIEAAGMCLVGAILMGGLAYKFEA